MGVIRGVTKLLGWATRVVPGMLSDNLREGSVDMVKMLDAYELWWSCPETGKGVFSRACGICEAADASLQCLCDLEDHLGVQNLSPDWDARTKETLRVRFSRIVYVTCMSDRGCVEELRAVTSELKHD